MRRPFMCSMSCRVVVVTGLVLLSFSIASMTLLSSRALAGPGRATKNDVNQASVLLKQESDKGLLKQKLSVIFVPTAANDPVVVLDFEASTNASVLSRVASVAWLEQGRTLHVVHRDESSGALSRRKELLPTPENVRATEIEDAWMVTLHDLGNWQGERPRTSRKTAHDGPAVVSVSTARLTIEGTLLDLEQKENASQVVDATLYGTWKAVKGRAIVRRGSAKEVAFVLVSARERRVITRGMANAEAPFVVDSKVGCGRNLPAASILGWREERRVRPRRAQIFNPHPWACGKGVDIARIRGETRKGTQRVPLHGVWLRRHSTR